MSSRTRKWVLACCTATIVVVLLGPRPKVDPFLGFPEIGPDVAAYVLSSEARVPDLRPGDGKRIVWADPVARDRRDVTIVYLHGFTADSHEVEPLVTNLGRALGANVFFARLAGHGRGPDALGDVQVADWFADMGEAMAVARRLGERVVLVGTSTGGTLAVWAAGHPDFEEGLAALVLLSPNFHPADRRSRLLLWPWGELIARAIEGRERCFETHNAEHARHWTECHPTSALLPMMALVEHVRTSDLERIQVPTLVVYVPDDTVVDAGETERAYARIGAATKALFAVEHPGDPDRHVPAGDILSPGTTAAVEARILAFLRDAWNRY
jgi:esterase/lipase